jgi:hypothetical protein
MASAAATRFSALIASMCLVLAACGVDSNDSAPAGPIGAETGLQSAPAAEVEVAPERYFGRFGDASNPEEMRGQYFVTAAHPPPMADNFPDIPLGYIMVSAVWADVAPYYMKPVSATRFEQQFLSSFDTEGAVVEFDLDADGRAVSLRFLNAPNDQFGSRARLGDVPEEYR